MKKTTKLTMAVFALLIGVLFLANHFGTISIDWNGLFNGTLESIITGIVMVPVTILLYRYLYHRSSKN